MFTVVPDNPTDEKFARMTERYLNDRFLSGIHFHRADMELSMQTLFGRQPTLAEIDDRLRRALTDTLVDRAQRHGPSHPSVRSEG